MRLIVRQVHRLLSCCDQVVFRGRYQDRRFFDPGDRPALSPKTWLIFRLQVRHFVGAAVNYLAYQVPRQF